ncbi:glycosyltransferase family protein [Pseudomonas defluvii]|uniref:capsule biosynthesis protein n=1 Tax=Pseudomonas defluvii TaxID=1876757 RepID=UPI0039069A36
MTTETERLWRARAKQLDAYRWALWREKYGVVGAAVRVIRDAAIGFKHGIGAWMRATKAPESPAQRVLVLHGSPKLLAQRRKSGLIEALRECGHDVVEVAIEPLEVAVRQNLLYQPPRKVPLRYYAHAAYAEWLARHHKPSLVLSERHGSLVSPFLRLSLNVQDKYLVHLAHATTVERSQRLGMTDYDYYLLFGQSSLAALQRRKFRFGTTKAVVTGSYLIDQSYNMPAAASDLRLLVLGVGPDKEKREGYRRTYSLICEWAAKHPNVPITFKAHPRSRADFWRKAAATHPNIKVASPDVSLADALEQSSVVLNIMSNAALEASVASRPIIYVNADEDSDPLEQSRFFGECVTDAKMLDERLAWLCRHYDKALHGTRAFAEYHLAHGVRGQDVTAKAIDSLIHGQPLPFIELEGTIG